MPENKKVEDLSVDDIIKDVMREKRRKSRGLSSSEAKVNDSISIKSHDIKTEDLSSNDYKSFLNSNKTDNSIGKNGSMNHSKSDADAVQSQLDYMKKSLGETPKSDDALMSDLFANAVQKSGKRLSPAQQEAIKEVRNTKGIISSKPKKAEFPDNSSGQRSEDTSLNDLVAGAMLTKKSKTTISDISEPVGSAEVVDAQISEDETKPKRRKWSLKKKVSVILCYVFGIIFLLCGAGISAFSYLTGKLDRSNAIVKFFDIGQSDIGSDDTVDAIDYEQMLKDKLAKSAANVVSDKDVANILLVGEDLRATIDNTAERYLFRDTRILCSENQCGIFHGRNTAFRADYTG